jgi:hypothetical protein
MRMFLRRAAHSFCVTTFAARPQRGEYMKSFVAKMLIAIFGLTLAAAPLAASAAPWGVGVGVSGPGYSVHVGNGNRWHAGYGYRPGWRAPHRGWYGRPVAVSPYYVEGYYGIAPGGYYGYYHHGRWFAHRHWRSGVWLYF